jgi:hypothetical protein
MPDLSKAILGWYYDDDDKDISIERIADDVHLLMHEIPADFEGLNLDDVIDYAADCYGTTDDGMWAMIEACWHEAKVS